MSMTSLDGPSASSRPPVLDGVDTITNAQQQEKLEGNMGSMDSVGDLNFTEMSEEMRAEQDQALAQLHEYEIGETLGVGAHGEVKRATHKLSGQSVAIKFVQREDCKEDGKRLTEVAALRKLKHPHVVRLYDVIRTPTQVLLVLECLAGGELFDYLVSRHRLSESEARRFTRQLMSALTYCHDQGIVHRDLKLENLLLDAEGNVKVTDFGFSNVYRDGNLMSTFVGSPAYAAPEIMANEKYSGPKADIWSLGVIVYTLLAGEMPFQDDNIADKLRHITQAAFEMPAFLSDDAQHLIHSVLQRDPDARPSMEELWHHPWISQGGKLSPLVLSVPPPSEDLVQRCMEEIVAHTDIDVDELRACLRENTTTRATATYYLLLDKMMQEAKEEEKQHEIQRIIAGLRSMTPTSSRPGSPLLLLRPNSGGSGGSGGSGDSVGAHEPHSTSDAALQQEARVESNSGAPPGVYATPGIRARAQTDGHASSTAAAWRHRRQQRHPPHPVHRAALFHHQTSLDETGPTPSHLAAYATPSRRRNSTACHPHPNGGARVARRGLAFGGATPARARRMTTLDGTAHHHHHHHHHHHPAHHIPSHSHEQHQHVVNHQDHGAAGPQHQHQHSKLNPHTQTSPGGGAPHGRVSAVAAMASSITGRRRVSTLGALVETRDEEVNIYRSPTGSRISLLSRGVSREGSRQRLMLAAQQASQTSLGAASSISSSRKSSATSSLTASPVRGPSLPHHHPHHHHHHHSHHRFQHQHPHPPHRVLMQHHQHHGDEHSLLKQSFSTSREAARSAEDLASAQKVGETAHSAEPAPSSPNSESRRQRQRSYTTAVAVSFQNRSPRRPSHKVTLLGQTPQTIELEMSPLPLHCRRASRARRSSALQAAHRTAASDAESSPRNSIEFSDVSLPGTARGSPRDSIILSHGGSKRTSVMRYHASYPLAAVEEQPQDQHQEHHDDHQMAMPTLQRQARVHSPGTEATATVLEQLTTASDEELVAERRRSSRTEYQFAFPTAGHDHGAHSDGECPHSVEECHDGEHLFGAMEVDVEVEGSGAGARELQPRGHVGVDPSGHMHSTTDHSDADNASDGVDSVDEAEDTLAQLNSTGFSDSLSPVGSSAGASAHSSRRSSSSQCSSSRLLDVPSPQLEGRRRRRSSSTSRLPTLNEHELENVLAESGGSDGTAPSTPLLTVTSTATASPTGPNATVDVSGASRTASRRSSSSRASDVLAVAVAASGGSSPGPVSSTGSTRGSRRGRRVSVSNLTGSMKRKKGMDALDLASSMRAFGAATTSVKPAHVVVHELKQALKACDVLFEERGPVKLRCTRVAQPGASENVRARRSSLISMETLVWEITVQVLPDLNMRGIHLRRIKGNHWDYKKLVDEVIRKAKL